MDSSFVEAIGYKEFEIRETEDHGAKTALILPDIATCADCLREILDPNDRRHGYPFTNCTNCGPRFSIIEALPYDRARTSMKKFTMCANCEREYRKPVDRRFHAQPNACPVCGPHLELWDGAGRRDAQRNEALLAAAAMIRDGNVVALKGLGGFQLIVDARNEEAVVRLRTRKHREEKPFALLFPSLEMAQSFCEISELEQRLLLSPEAPIVILRKIVSPLPQGEGGVRAPSRASLQGGGEHMAAPHDPHLQFFSHGEKSENETRLADSIAPGNPNLGVMLPYTPLHHLLMRELNFPIVATSGNLSDEPICIDEAEALKRLRGIADYFLVHNRPIVRHVDDSIMRTMHGRELMLRRARGYAPLPIHVHTLKTSTLAVGAHLKNTVALSVGENVFVSQHIGDLETEQAYRAFKNAVADLPRLYEAKPEIIACDMHPEYLSTKFAHEHSKDRRLFPVQHHWAHIAACMAENEIEAPALGVAWDGTGFGPDGTIWGGEFLLAKDGAFERVAHLRQFRLPGGDAAIKKPRRTALGLLYEILGDDLWQQTDLSAGFAKNEIPILRQILEKQVNAPLTSSAGRLFDAVAALLGLRDRITFEGQAAMDLEFAVRSETSEAYAFNIKDSSPLIVDWEPGIIELITDHQNNARIGVIAAKFHNMLVEIIVAVARKIGEPKVVLSGGCFQNRYLTERAIDRLSAENFRPYWHQRIPPNDGGIAPGQIVAANWASARESEVPWRSRRTSRRKKRK